MRTGISIIQIVSRRCTLAQRWRQRLRCVLGSYGAGLVLLLLLGLPSVLSAQEAEDRRRSQEPANDQGGPREWVNSLGMEFVLIEAGTFEMGSPVTEPGRWDNETLHRVTISQPFYLGKYEVTQEQWKMVMGDNPSQFSDCGATCPVEWVSWEEAQVFIEELNALEGVDVYRLPTEAEWEYAARGGTQTAYSFGAGAGRLRLYGWCAVNSGQRPHPVGEKRPNDFGLFDMHGNVWEWVADWYANDFSSDPVTDPSGPSTSTTVRVYRGGSWYNPSHRCRSAVRNGITPDYRFRFLGFRVARTP